MENCIPCVLHPTFACEFKGVILLLFACCCFTSSVPHKFWADFNQMKQSGKF